MALRSHGPLMLLVILALGPLSSREEKLEGDTILSPAIRNDLV